MPHLHLTTFIAAPIERVFDLSRCIAVYKNIFAHRNEIFSSGAGGNLVNHGETTTYHAKHLGRIRIITLRVTSFDKPVLFIEEQVKGDLKMFKHEHHFKKVDNGTILIDLVEYDYPRDFFGNFIGKFYMKTYLESYLSLRNPIIKQYAETEKWHAVLTV